MTDKSMKVVITGNTGGIAAATARLLVQHGCDVVISARDEARLEQAVAELGPKAKGFVMDLTDPASVTNFFEAVGTFDHLLTPAAMSMFAPIAEMNSQPRGRSSRLSSGVRCFVFTRAPKGSRAPDPSRCFPAL